MKAAAHSSMRSGHRVAATPLQSALWYLDGVSATAPTDYLVHSAMRVRGNLDLEALRDAVARVWARHDVLRAVFEKDEDGGVTMWVPPPADDRAAEIRLAEVDDEDDLVRELTRLVTTPLSLDEGPLAALHVVRVCDTDHVLALIGHHIVIDGTSVDVLWREITEFYRAGIGGAPTPELPRGRTFLEHAAASFEASTVERAERHVRDAAARVAEHAHLLDFGPLSEDSEAISGASTMCRALPADATDQLRRVARDTRTSLFTIGVTCFHEALARVTGQSDFIVGAPFDCRLDAGLSQTVGHFVNTLALGASADPSLTLRERLMRMRDEVWDAIDQGDAPLAWVVAAVRQQGGEGSAPLIQAFFSTETAASTPDFGQVADLFVRPFPIDRVDGKFEVSLTLIEHDDVIDLRLESRPGALSASAMNAVLNASEQLLKTIEDRLDQPLGNTRADGAAENPLDIARGHIKPMPFRALGEMLTAQAVAAPEAVAVRVDGQSFTYRRLDALAAAFARNLISHGVGPGDVVAVPLERSLALIVAYGAIARAGAAVLPMSLDDPSERRSRMIAAARPRIVIGTPGSALRGYDGVTRIDLDPEALAKTQPDAPIRTDDLCRAPSPLDPAYVLFTSGSTGEPKGVVVPAAALVNRLAWVVDLIGLQRQEDVRVLHKTPITFDVSLWELIWPLVIGATVVVAPPGAHRDPVALARLIEAERIDIVHFVPSMLNGFLLEPEARRAARLGTIICSGESLSRPTVQAAARLMPEVRIFNLYGPTEAAIDVTVGEVNVGAVGHVPIGRPVWNTSIYVLDEALRPVPVGGVGDLYISGPQLATGYAGSPSITAGAFLPDPYGPPGSRMYRTGDRGSCRPDGQIRFLGRTDRQVKINGQRIELDEIATAVRTHSSVRAVAVIPAQTGSGYNTRLVAYVVADRNASWDPADVLATAASLLPSYMVPSTVMVLDKLPFTSSGKLDVLALPQPDEEDIESPSSVETSSPEVDAMRRLFGEILGIPDVSVGANFFALGGDSISSMRLVSRARRLGFDVSEKAVFDHPTPQALASMTRSHEPDAAHDAGRPGDLPDSPAVEWWRSLGGPSHGFHQSTAVSTPAGATLATLETVVQAVCNHHEALRTVVVEDDSGWRLTVAADGDLPAIRVEHRTCETEPSDVEIERERARLGEEVGRAGNRPISLLWFDRGPSSEGVLVIAVHHVCIDIVSWNILHEDLIDAWSAVASGLVPRLTPVSVAYRTWVELTAGRRTVPPAVPGALTDTMQEYAARFTHGVRTTQTSARGLRAEHFLLAALVRALRESGIRPHEDPVRLDVEGHGRGDAGGVDIARTVGWLTTITGLEVSAQATSSVDELAADIAPTLEAAREGRTPKATATARLRDSAAEFVVGVNVVGIMEGEDSPRSNWMPLPRLESVRGGMSANTPMPHVLEVTISFERATDVLVPVVQAAWSPERLSRATVERLLRRWDEALAPRVQDSTRMRPEDLTAEGFAQKELDIFLEEFE